MNHMATHATSTTKSEKRGKRYKKHKSDTESAAYTDGGRTYGIDRLNLVTTAHDSDSDYKWLLVQCSKIQMDHKNNSNLSNEHEFNIISNF